MDLHIGKTVFFIKKTAGKEAGPAIRENMTVFFKDALFFFRDVL